MSVAEFIPKIPMGILSGGVSSSDNRAHCLLDIAKIKLKFIGDIESRALSAENVN